MACVPPAACSPESSQSKEASSSTGKTDGGKAARPPPGSCTCQRQVWSWEVGVVGLLKPSSPCWGATGIQIRLCLGLHSVCAGLELSRAPGAY